MDELDLIPADLDKRLDAVVEITADPAEVTARLLARAARAAPTTRRVITRRLQVYAEQTEPIVAVYSGVAWCARWTGWARSKVHERIVAALAADPPRAPARAAGRRGWRSRPLSSWPPCARLVWSLAALQATRGRVRPGPPTGQLDAIAQEVIADAGAPVSSAQNFPASSA